jgi:hypothetical protein
MPDADIIPTDMRSALDGFDRAAEQIIAAFVGPLDAKPPPSLIYHYTNDVGLKGILESGKIWLTDIFDLNDPSELSHGFSHAVNILNRMSAGGPPESQLFAQQFEAFLTQGGIQAAAHYFVCSFSSNGDDLGQWRAYGDNGRGYAVGFDALNLEKGFTRDADDEPIPNNSTFPLTYKDAELAEIHRQIIEPAFPLISLPRGRGLSSEAIRAYMGELSITLTMHAVRSVLFFKHEAYSNEKEYRFLQIYRADRPAPEVRRRARAYALVKYREFDWSSAAHAALKHIIVGPAADYERAARFARDCVPASHADSVEIARSAIPYRAT